MHIFKISDSHSHCERWGRSLGRYDDGLQKEAHHITGVARHIGWEQTQPEENQTTAKQDDEILERSYEETRRSVVQIRPTPPKVFFCANTRALCGFIYLELDFPKIVSERRKSN